jgi:hypothetical protein
MPGTGHSSRYKGSISNRVRISPFQRLAEWNSQLLGADGSVPTITGGGGSLAFKKLDASDIDGVMHNSATANLNMNSFGILSVPTISNDSKMTISTIGGLFLSGDVQISDTSGRIGFYGNTPIIKPTVATPVSASSIHTALVQLGLVS